MSKQDTKYDTRVKNKKSRKKIRNRIIMTLVIVALLGGSGAFYVYNNAKAGEPQIVQKEVIVQRGDITVGVTESGSVTIGTLSQDLEALEDILGSSSSSNSSSGGTSSMAGMGGVASQMSMSGASGNNAAGGTSSSSNASDSSNLGASLEVEEVYLAVGQKAEIGDAILKLSSESVEEYRTELEDAVESAELAYKEAEYNAKSQKLSAQNTYDSNVAQGNVAQSEYDLTVAQLQESVDSAQAAVDESAAKIQKYHQKIAKGKDFYEELAAEQANYNSLLSRLQSAQNNQTTKTVEAKKKYSEAMLNYNNAGSLYDINVSGADSDMEDAKESLDEAKEALTNFNSLIGDGMIYAQYTGVVATIGYAEGDALSSSTEVATFSDTTEVTMTVSVSQEDISSVKIGDVVKIALTAYEDKNYEGVVESMDTSASSGSSTVSYDVTVVFTGDTSDVYQDMTGSVTFISEQATDVCYVSRKAITRDRQASYAKIKRGNGDMEQVEVTTGISDGVNIEISSGLNEGDTVIIESQVGA